jgi:hypothetical protein
MRCWRLPPCGSCCATISTAIRTARTSQVTSVGLTLFVLALFAIGLRRPFLWVLAYVYIDVLVPQKISYNLLAHIPISLIAFVLCFGGWLALDPKAHTRFTLRQSLLLLLLAYCGLTTATALRGSHSDDGADCRGHHH